MTTTAPKTPRQRASRAKSAAKSAPIATPTERYVRHSKRPDWGVGRVVNEFVGLVRVRFSDGVTREFRDSVLESVDPSELSSEAIEALSAPDTPKPAPAPTRVPRVRPASSD